MNTSRFDRAIALIDQAHAEDPRPITIGGKTWPESLYHARRRTDWLFRLVDTPPELLQLAVRGQHLRRWTVPRDAYPRTREGYLRWRNHLKSLHAQYTADILRSVGYDEADISRVSDLIQKKRLKTDPDAQALEDTLCLVFLETQFADFARREAGKIVDIVRKTWHKMSPQAQNLALQIPLPEDAVEIVRQALEIRD